MKRRIPPLDPRPARHRNVSEEEVAVWQQALEGRPKPRPHAAPGSHPASPPPAAKPRPTQAPGAIDPSTILRLRRGTIAVEATLDLHGHSRVSAHRLLIAFVERAQARGIRTVLVVTGKGRGGEVGALRALLPRWLGESPLRERVLAYDAAGPRHGGGGAWYLRLRKTKKP